MRLKITEHKQLMKIAEANGFNQEDFEIVKKRGLVYIHLPDREPFTFYRKKETTLDENLQWKDVETYYKTTAVKKETPLTWADVKSNFEQWCSE